MSCARVLIGVGVLSLVVARPAVAQQQFKSGSLIIPMDTQYQDSGMLRAYGLLYNLLKNGVPVHWVIKAKKAAGDADLTTSSKDFKTGTAIPSHGYRGGPFVVEPAHAAQASPLITAWQTANTTTVVHIAQTDFVARSGRRLTAAPTIAVIADGHEDIAFKYLNAAAIPDRLGKIWSKTSPDVLSITEVNGPSSTVHNDGALFRASGQPAYCQIMTMHWGVNNVVDAVVAEYRQFLQFPTHMMAECQAVNAIENNVNGRFITPHGFLIDNTVADKGPFSFLNQDTPFAQMDGTYELVGGSERAYSLPAGDKFYDLNVVMIKDAATPLGQRSVWMTGYIDGKCVVSEDTYSSCTSGVGKVSYLGGHQYEVTLPMSAHPDTQGTRLFLNSLFEAGCATAEGEGLLSLAQTGPAWTTTPQVAYTLVLTNPGRGPSLDVVIEDTLPAGATHLSSSPAGTVSGSKVTWNIGDLPSMASRTIQLKLSLASHGTYVNTFSGKFLVGLTARTAISNTVTTVYQASPPPDAGSGPGLDGSVKIDAGQDSAAKDGSTKDSVAKDGSGSQDGSTHDGVSPSGDATGTKDSSKGDGVAAREGGHVDGSRPSDGGRGDAGSVDGRGADRGLAEGGGGGVGGSGGCDCSLNPQPQQGRSGLLLLGIVGVVVAARRRRVRRS